MSETDRGPAGKRKLTKTRLRCKACQSPLGTAEGDGTRLHCTNPDCGIAYKNRGAAG